MIDWIPMTARWPFGGRVEHVGVRVRKNRLEILYFLKGKVHIIFSDVPEYGLTVSMDGVKLGLPLDIVGALNEDSEDKNGRKN